MRVVSLTILARKKDGEVVPPRTKKTSPQLIPRMSRPILVPSEAYREWERAATGELLRQGLVRRVKIEGDKSVIRMTTGEPISYPVGCRALIYRDKLVGDAVGFYQAIADFLQDIGVVINDKFIVHWDGTRLLKDAIKPRIELELHRVGDAAPEQGLLGGLEC